MTQDMGNNISYCSKALAREMARSKQALGRLISMLRDCSATLRPQVRECLHFATPHSDQWSENAWSMARIWSENVFVRKERTLSPSRTNSQSVGHELRFIRYAAVLILMMVVGVSEIRGQHPFTLTTASDITNGTQHYYLIQSIERPSFYAIPHSNSDGAKVSTPVFPMPICVGASWTLEAILTISIITLSIQQADVCIVVVMMVAMMASESKIPMQIFQVWQMMN